MPDATIPAEALVRAARRFGTPVHVTSVIALADAARELEAAFPGPLAARVLAQGQRRPGRGGTTAPPQGWTRTSSPRASGPPPGRRALPNGRITLEGVGKSAADLRAAVRAARQGDPLRWVAVESAEELDALVAMAARAAGLGGAAGSRRSTCCCA